MKQGSTVLALGAALLLASPAAGQLWGFPDYALPSMTGAPTTWVAATLGRGLNDDSGKTTSWGAVAGRAEATASFMGGIALVTGQGEDEVTLGGSVGVDILQTEDFTLGVQGGLGWMSFDVGNESYTRLRFPLGVAFKTSLVSGDGSTAIYPWVMPRLNIARVSGGGDAETETDLGISGGASFNFENGFGIHTALDFLSANGGDPFVFGIGVHYLLGQR